MNLNPERRLRVRKVEIEHSSQMQLFADTIIVRTFAYGFPQNAHLGSSSAALSGDICTFTADRNPATMASRSRGKGFSVSNSEASSETNSSGLALY